MSQPRALTWVLNGFGRAAAVLGLNDGRGKFLESAFLHEHAKGGQHLADRGKSLERRRLKNGVKITFAQDLLAIFQAGPLVGQGTNGLGQNAQAFHENRNFAALGANDFAGRLDDVADVEKIGFGVTEVAGLGVGWQHEIAAQEELQLAGLILDMGESERALFAPGHEAAGDGRGLAVQFFKFAKDVPGVMRSCLLLTKRDGLMPIERSDAAFAARPLRISIKGFVATVFSYLYQRRYALISGLPV